MESANLTMTYCPPNITFTNIWVNHGVSQCFMDTVSSSLIALYLLLFGSIQLWMYRRYGTEIAFHPPKSWLYTLQKVLLFFVPILSIARIILQGTVLNDKQIYGYMVRHITNIVDIVSTEIYFINNELDYYIFRFCQQF